MADFDVSEHWFTDETGRRAALVAELHRRQSQTMSDAADGLAMRAWRLARRYWKQGRTLIPLDIWEIAGLGVLETVGLADRTSDGIYVRGTEAAHDWLFQRVEAGRAGGKKANRSKPKQTQANPSKRNPLTLTLTSTSNVDNKRDVDNNPPTPRKIHAVTKRESDAHLIFGRMEGAVRDDRQDEPDDERELAARECIGEVGWAIMLERWKDWDRFARYFREAYKKSSPTILSGQLRAYIAAKLIVNQR